MKLLLTFWFYIIPIIAQQLPANGGVPQGQIPQNMMQQPEPQPVDPTLLKKIDQYEKLIEKYPDNSDLHYNLGNLKYLAGYHEEAINEYRKNLSTLDEQKKSHALYNIGNSYFSQGKYQESADFYKKAMQANPNDEDMKINYELTRRMLQQQQQEQQQSRQSDNDKNEDKEEQQQEQQEQEKQQSENQDGEKKESGEEQEAQENQQEPEQKPGDEQSQKEEQQRLKEMSEEKQLAKEEAEAILNALKANQENLMKKKYVAKNRPKLEKDW